jgi:predicted alpha/beta superfamily hydrolase
VTKRHTVAGDLRLHQLESEHLGGSRTIAVWLPPGYGVDDVTRFPVLYLHDGQNVFDRATAFADEWQVDETALRLIKRGEISPLIVVAVYNSGDGRADEYAPAPSAEHGGGGHFTEYGRMLVEEVKPWVDRTYRTLPSAASTALGGSSLGGLATLALGFRYATVFSMLAALSPSVWWSDRAIVREVETLNSRPPTRIWLDAGTAEGPTVIPDVRALRDALVAKGWRVGQDLAYSEARGAGHNERAWAARVGPMLRYLFPGPAQPLGRTARFFRKFSGRWRAV